MIFRFFSFVSINFLISFTLNVILPQNFILAQEIDQSVVIEEIEIEGYTVFSSQTMETLVSPYRGQKITFEQLKQLTEDITNFYTNRGYLTSVLDDEGWGNLKLIPFVDAGRVWDTDGDFAQSLASIGLGINWQLRDFLFLVLDLAIPLTEVENRGNSLSDNGISFSLQLNL